MIRFLLLAVCLYVLPLPQTNAQYRILGFRGSYNNAGVLASDDRQVGDELARRGGFAGGLTYEYLTPLNLSIGVDMIYERRGFIQTYHPRYAMPPSPAPQTITRRFNYGYWSVPVRVSYYVGEKLYGFGSAGVVPALMLGAKQKTMEDYGEGNSSKWKKSNASPSSRFDLSAWFELGVGYKMSWAFWPYASVAYQPGITSFRERNLDPDIALRHKVWCISIGTKLEFVKVRWSAKD